jgi:hypothetical protein
MLVCSCALIHISGLPGLLRSLEDLAGVLGYEGKYEEVEEKLRRALGLRDTVSIPTRRRA